MMSKPGSRALISALSRQSIATYTTPPDSTEETTHPKVDFSIYNKKTVSMGHRRRTSRRGEGGFSRVTSPFRHPPRSTPPLRCRPYGLQIRALPSSCATSRQRPSWKEERVLHNSFGAALPMPRLKRQSRLSEVSLPAEVQQALRGGKMPPGLQLSRNILTSQVQDF